MPSLETLTQLVAVINSNHFAALVLIALALAYRQPPRQ